MTPADPLVRLADAARAWGVPLDAAALGKISGYLDLVAAKNATTNLTAEASREDLVLKHAADGVFAASVLRARLGPAPRILDLGSGGGFIGIVLKLSWPEAEVTLMESVERKYRFLSAAATATGAKGLKVLQRRAGDGRPLTGYEKDFDCVIERALAPLPDALRLAWPMLGAKGLFAAFQTVEPDPAEAALAKALAATGGRVLQSCAYRRPGEEQERRLMIFARGED